MLDYDLIYILEKLKLLFRILEINTWGLLLEGELKNLQSFKTEHSVLKIVSKGQKKK